MLRTLGGILLEFLWQGSAIGAVATCLLGVLRGSNPRARYAVLCSALALCVLVLGIDGYQEWRSTPDVSQAGASPLFMVEGRSAGADWLAWLAIAWLFGAAVMALRFAGGMSWVRGLVNDSQRLIDPYWEERFFCLLSSLRISRAVRLHVVHRISSPVTVGWLRPVILVPVALLSNMPCDFLEALLAHELAHIKRYDYLVNLLQSILEILLFYHPVVWWLSRQIRVEREKIADDMAAQVLAEPKKLAFALDYLSRTDVSAPEFGEMAPMARGGEVVHRIRRLIHPQSISHRKWAMPLFLLCASLGVVIFFGYFHSDEPAASYSNGQLSMSSKAQEIIEQMGPTHILVVDAASGEALVRRGENTIVPIASLTKLMTAMVAIDAKPDMKKMIRIEQEDADATVSGSSELPVGAVLSFRDLFQLTLMSSDSRAAYAIARNYPGGIEEFNRSFQRKVSVLGLQHTTLEEPTGLSPNNTSTASDIELIVDAAAAYPEITHDTTQASESIRVDGKSMDYRNTNPLVGQKGWDIVLSKTGFTDQAGRCLVMRIRVEGRELTMVLLNARQALQGAVSS
jgi:D-alanyl-D-alanine endopeptidase (penicillin-binding protein 7)